MNQKILAAISVAFAAGLLLAATPSAYAHVKEACTPGYWKNNSDGTYDDVNLQQYFIDNYGVDLGSSADITLAEAVSLKGGPQNAFLRYAGAVAYSELTGLSVYSPWVEIALQRFVDGNTSGAVEKFEKLFGESICPINAFGIRT